MAPDEQQVFLYVATPLLTGRFMWDINEYRGKYDGLGRIAEQRLNRMMTLGIWIQTASSPLPESSRLARSKKSGMATTGWKFMRQITAMDNGITAHQSPEKQR